MANEMMSKEVGLDEIPACLDQSQDDAIITSLQTYVPITSERNVWAFWDAGFKAMPAWTQRNVIGWVRLEEQSWTVRVLDSVEQSPNNVLNFVEPSDFPEAYCEGRMNGNDASQHVADFARVALLYKYGGVYMDVSVMLVRRLDDICWSAISDSSTPYEVAGMAQQMREHPGQMLNSFISCRKGNPFIHRWKEVFLRMWAGRSDANGLHNHSLVRHLGLLKLKAPSISADADWAGFSDYVAQILAFERVRLNSEPGPDGFDGPAYFKDHFFLLDANKEMFLGQGFDQGERIAKLLSLTRRKPGSSEAGVSPTANNDDDDDQLSAKKFVHNVLTSSSLCKFSQGTARLGLKFLVGKYWSRPENSMADCNPGTWGAVLREGSVRHQQARMPGRSLEPLNLPEELGSTTMVGILEPVVK